MAPMIQLLTQSSYLMLIYTQKYKTLGGKLCRLVRRYRFSLCVPLIYISPSRCAHIRTTVSHAGNIFQYHLFIYYLLFSVLIQIRYSRLVAIILRAPTAVLEE